MKETNIRTRNIKNIIIICDFGFINGGAAKVAITSACELAKRGVNVIYFTAVEPIDMNVTASHVKVISLQQYDILHDPKRLRAVIQGVWNRKSSEQLCKLLNTFNPLDTVIHIHGINKVLSASVLKVLSKTSFKVFWTLHDYFTFCPNGGMFNYHQTKICEKKPMSIGCIKCNCDPRSYPQKIWRVCRQIVANKWIHKNKNIHFIYISKLNKKISYPYLKDVSSNWHFLQNPIFLSASPQIVDIKNNSKYLFIARLAREKGIDLFCKAITELKLQGLVLGDGYLLEEYKTKYPNIEFAGWVSGDKKNKLIQQGKALIFPSLWYEGAPLTILEMKSYGIPCIVPDRCAASEEVEDEKTGYIFKIGDIESLKEAILKYESCDKINMQRNILERFHPEDYTIETHVNNLLRIYDTD